MRSLRLALVALAALTAPIATAPAQFDEVPSLRWKTIRTEHFRIHYEPQLEAWATKLASQIESVREAVAARVGYTPPQVIDLIVEDPLNVPNGSAMPVLTFPAMRFWATPPAPTSVIGNSRGWGELLAIHEYAHLAHLLRPSRAPFDKFFAAAGLLPFGPITMSPAWVAEGYATVIEGELSGSGRPNGVARAAILRQLALEGYLPAYGELDATGRFNGGAMRYLVGSAYLEWLQEPRGDSVLPQLWRRATARKKRDFEEAFKGTFGDAPAVLYGRFVSELTYKAHQARETLERQGLAEGTLVQHWNWGVGAPAISPDGKLLAVRRASPGEGSRIVVTGLEPKPLSKKDSTAREEQLEEDPEDLLDIEVYPRPLKGEGRLNPVAGASYDSPRWFRDSKRLLVTRSVPRPDGRIRPDLFIWDRETDDVRRVTRAAGIVLAEPLPSGTEAIAVTCGSGSCSLVRVSLENGDLAPFATGGIDASYHGVRVSPNGKLVASSRQRGRIWVPVVIDVATGMVREIGPNDGASRHSATWESDSTLIVVSEASGIPTLERLPLGPGAPTVVARTTGMAAAPDVAPDGRVWWLDMHGRGYDLRVSDGGTALATAAKLDTTLYPAVRKVDTSKEVQFDAAPVPAAKPYGIGPINGTLLAANTTAADGESNGIGLHLNDVLGRGNLYAMGGAARNGAWDGYRAALTWRGLPPALRIEYFDASQNLSEQGRIPLGLDVEQRGLLLSLEQQRVGAHGTSSLRLGFYDGSWSVNNSAAVDRAQAFAVIKSDAMFTPTPTLAVRASLRAQHSLASLDDVDFSRTQGELALSVAKGSALGVGVRAKLGAAHTGVAFFEQFLIGGSPTPYVDDALLDNRITHLGIPTGTQIGNRFFIVSAETPGPLRLYHDWIAAGFDGYGAPSRVVGGEFTLDVPRIAMLRIPSGWIKAGLSHILEDEANIGLRNATIGYVGLSFTP